MQQPRQMYGLGSFVKKITRKVTKPFTKVARKIVPKEIAGIMRTAAPFLPPGYREAAYLLGTAKQTGRISPVDLAIALAPQVGKIETSTGQTVSQRIGDLPAFGETPLGTKRTLKDVLVGGRYVENVGTPQEIETATSGLFGRGGEMFQIGKGTLPGTGEKFGDEPGILDTKVGRTLFGKPEMKKGKATGEFVPSFLKIGSTGVSLASFLKDAKTPEEAGNMLVDATGNSEDYQRGFDMFAQLQPGIFDIRPEFRLIPPTRVGIKSGGLMRENYALGTMPTAQESGLGGLPIEADMRYTGGFMPYGAKEKADDVPARLSKNEFVFTADAVRAAGGGSVQKGAQRMYNTMKQLESKPEAKGMMA